jgi:hypothetical protein
MRGNSQRLAAIDSITAPQEKMTENRAFLKIRLLLMKKHTDKIMPMGEAASTSRIEGDTKITGCFLTPLRSVSERERQFHGIS